MRNKENIVGPRPPRKGIDGLSIIIPTLNEERYLPNLLGSIADSTKRKQLRAELQTIIVDGKSEDNTVQVAEIFKDRISDLEIVSTERGVSHQRNVGAEHAKHDHILFLDADVTLPKKTLERLTRKTDPNKRIVDWMIHIPDKFRVRDYLGTFSIEASMIALHKIVPMVVGSFILTTKENHQRIGGFKEGYGEDMDYAKRSVDDGASHHIHLRPHIKYSTRRQQEMGWINQMVLSTKLLTHIIRGKGPLKDVDYKFGHFGKK